MTFLSGSKARPIWHGISEQTRVLSDMDWPSVDQRALRDKAAALGLDRLYTSPEYGGSDVNLVSLCQFSKRAALMFEMS
jgi:hypothetical protein